MGFETPDSLRARLKLGREEYCQRLLTSLIVGGPYPLWNKPSSPSRQGLSFLRGLWALSFREAWPGDDAVFIDEFELPPRVDTERGGSPDYAVTWPEELWLVELKTERASHRRGQIPLYLELCRYHHPTRRVCITYLTPPGDYGTVVLADESALYGHVIWSQVTKLIGDTWRSADGDQRAVLEGLLVTLDRLDLPPKQWRVESAVERVAAGAEHLRDVLAESLALARRTAEDGSQRALDWSAPSLSDLQALRLELRNRLAATTRESGLLRVRPWLWQWASSGQPMTSAGRQLGYELRLSRYRSSL